MHSRMRTLSMKPSFPRKENVAVLIGNTIIPRSTEAILLAHLLAQFFVNQAMRNTTSPITSGMLVDAVASIGKVSGCPVRL